MKMKRETRAPSRQVCNACAREDGFDFHVPDAIWERVVPRELRDKIVCLCCFDRFAAEQQVDYSRYVKLLFFAGDQACFEFRVVRAAAA
jgi:hypothetical protein